MKFRHIYILFTALLLLITACSDEQPVPGSGNAPQTELIPLHFNVSGFAVAETRGTVADQKDSLSEVGVFLMSQSEYEALLAGDVVYDGNNTLDKNGEPVSYPYYHNHNLENIEPYNAERNNIKFTVDADDNTLAPAQTDLKLYYSTTGGTVVFAYAPYRDDMPMTKEMLFQPGSVSVPENQSEDEVVKQNDFYLATPVMKGAATGNPVNWYHKYITLEFRHQYARIVLASNGKSLQNMCWDLAEDADSVGVFVKDIPTGGTREVDNLGANFQYDTIATGRIFMASYSLKEDMPDTITSTALVLPSQESVMPRFGLVFYRGGQELKTVSLSVRGSDKKVVLSRGMSKTFSCNYGEEDKLRDAFARGLDYTLNADVDLAEPLILEEGDSMTLNLNGHTISMEKECTGSYNMITNKGVLAIRGEGEISFTDTSAGGGDVWGSYTIYNSGTLDVSDATIVHYGSTGDWGTNRPTNISIDNHMGKVTVNSGTISSKMLCSLRDYTAGGEIVINGGKFEGQIWMQGLGTGSSSLTINGGEFELLYGYDGSSVYLTNGTNDIELSVTGGLFNTEIGVANAEKAGVKGSIKGGTFTEIAKDNTNAALIAEGYGFVSNGDGTYSLQPSVGLTDEKADSDFEALSRRNGKR